MDQNDEGFQYIDEDNTPRALCCSICMSPYTLPVHIDCGHTFCRYCISMHLFSAPDEITATCPECREPVLSDFVLLTRKENMLTMQMLDDLKVRCIALGCTWVGPRGNYEDHRHKCGRFSETPSCSTTNAADSYRKNSTTYGADKIPIDDCSDEDSLFFEENGEFIDFETSSAPANRSEMADASTASATDLFSTPLPVLKLAQPPSQPPPEIEQVQSIDFSSSSSSSAIVDDTFDDSFFEAMDSSSMRHLARVTESNDYEDQIYTEPVLALNCTIKDVLSREDIPLMAPQDSVLAKSIAREENRRSRAVKSYNGVFFSDATSNGRNQGDGARRRVSGILVRNTGVCRDGVVLYHCFNNETERRLYESEAKHRSTEGVGVEKSKLYGLRRGFPRPTGYFRYDFTEENTGQVMAVRYSGTENRVHTHRFNLAYALAPSVALVEAKPSEWCQAVWMTISDDLLARKERLVEFKDQLVLPESAFCARTRNLPLSMVFFDYVEPQFRARGLANKIVYETLTNTAVFKRYFFHREIEYLHKNWFSTIEVVMALNPYTLMALYETLSPNGCPQVKRVFYPFLFYRPTCKVEALIESAMPDNGRLSHSAEILFRARDMTVEQLFKCNSRKFQWTFPRIKANLFNEVERIVFQRCRRAMPNGPHSIKNTIRIVQAFDVDLSVSEGSTYALLEDVRSILSMQMESREEFYANLRNLTESSNTLRAIEIGTRTPQCKRVLVDAKFFENAEMFKTALSHIIDDFLSSKRCALSGTAAQSSYSDEHYERTYTFPEAHPLCGRQFRFPLHEFTPSSEQWRAIYSSQALPIIAVNGPAGSGKTGMMRAIAQQYHPDSVIYIAATAAAAQEVGRLFVCARSMTAARVLVLHSKKCTWRQSQSGHAMTTNFLADKLNPFKGNPHYEENDGRSHRCAGKYYCDQFDCTFDACPIEKIKLVLVDETSMLSVADFCRLIFMFSRCCPTMPKFVLGGDMAQLPAISSGDLQATLMHGMERWLTDFHMDHRFNAMDTGARPNLLRHNAYAIRDGDFERMTFDRHCTIVHTGVEELGRTFQPNRGSADDATYTMIHIAEPERFAKREAIEASLRPAIEYLIAHDKDVRRVRSVGETSHIQFICGTHRLRSIVHDIVDQAVFYPRLDKHQFSSYRYENSDDRSHEHLQVGKKFVYTKNEYKIGLYNNVMLVVVDIEDVVLPKSRENGTLNGTKATKVQAAIEKQAAELVADTSGRTAADDIISESGSAKQTQVQLGEASGQLHKDMVSEFLRYQPKFAQPYTTRMNGKRKIMSTLYAQTCAPMRDKLSIGRRIVAVPASNIGPDGRPRSMDGVVYIPWTANHWRRIRPATALTVHGMQGRECDVVVIVAPKFYDKADTRELFYVAATRAKKRVIIISTDGILQRIIENSALSRKTFMGDYIRDFLIETYGGDNNELTLPSDNQVIRDAIAKERIEEEKRNASKNEKQRNDAKRQKTVTQAVGNPMSASKKPIVLKLTSNMLASRRANRWARPQSTVVVQQKAQLSSAVADNSRKRERVDDSDDDDGDCTVLDFLD